MFKLLLGKLDGWHLIPKIELYHYFFEKQSLCGAYNAIPVGAHQDNDPSRYCKVCEHTAKKLCQMPSIVRHYRKNKDKLSMAALFVFLEKVGGLKKFRAKQEPVKSGEKVLALITSHPEEKSK